MRRITGKQRKKIRDKNKTGKARRRKNRGMYECMLIVLRVSGPCGYI
jgi:hypothetical protein